MEVEVLAARSVVGWVGFYSWRRRQGLGGGERRSLIFSTTTKHQLQLQHQLHMLSRLASDNVVPVVNTRGLCEQRVIRRSCFSSNLRLFSFPISDAPCHLRFMSQPEGNNDAEGLL
jgi:hypothetical protein